MRNVVDKIIDDAVLTKYSYKGAGPVEKKKKPFCTFINIVNFIVRTSMVAYNDYNDGDIGFEKLTEKEVLLHFKSSYLKYAKQRTEKKNS